MPRPLPPRISFWGNRLALDFINTERVRAGKRIELLPSNSALFAWARAAGLAAPHRPAGPGHRLDRRARPLRAAIRALVLARIDNRPPPRPALAILNRLLVRTVRPLTIAPGRRLTQTTTCKTPLNILGHVAEDAADLLCADLPHLRRCGNANCIQIFLDVSRTHRRRWCSMRTCGNRDKVNRHHARTRAARAPQAPATVGETR